jgi:multisubunit Na+/H+ antiporter MnhB subunit
VLASNGLIGILVFLPTFIILPLVYIRKAANDSKRLESLSALVLIVSVSIFGLTETWVVRAPFIAIFAVYFTVLFTSIGNVGSRRTGTG